MTDRPIDPSHRSAKNRPVWPIPTESRFWSATWPARLPTPFDVNRATIFAILQRAGIKSRYRILTDRDVASATAMYEAGQSLASIAKHFDVADRTVLNAFRRVGVPTGLEGRTQ